MHHSALLCCTAAGVKHWDTTEMWLSLCTPRGDGQSQHLGATPEKASEAGGGEGKHINCLK